MTILSNGFAAVAAASITLLVPAHAAQLELPADPDPDIVVYGITEDARELRSFISEIGEVSDGQLARWQRPICPEVVGMQPEFNNYVRETIRSVARLSGAGVQPDGCSRDVVVIMSADPQAWLDDVRAGRIDLLQSLSARERDRMASSNEVVRVWSRLETRGSRGDRIQNGEVSYNARESGSGALGFPSIRGSRASRISRAARSDIDFRAILIDLDQLNGQTMQQLSAFAAMMALGEFDVSEPIMPAYTILNLFHDPAATPADLTNWDIAYLRGLYASDDDAGARRQRSHIFRYVREDLAATED